MTKVIAIDRGDVCGDYDLSRFDTFLTKNGYDTKKEKRYFQSYKGDFDRAKMSEKQFWTWLKKALWFDGAIETLMQNNSKNLVVNWKLLDLIQSLKKKYTIVLRSNMDISSIRQIKKEVPLKKFFDAIYFSWDYKMWKTESPVVNHIRKKYKCVPSEIVLIDDFA